MSPLRLVGEWIHCCTKISGKTVEYLVTDHMNNLAGSDYVMLEDEHGKRKDITAEKPLLIGKYIAGIIFGWVIQSPSEARSNAGRTCADNFRDLLFTLEHNMLS